VRIDRILTQAQPFRDEYGRSLPGNLTLQLRDFLDPNLIPPPGDPAYLHICREVKIPFGTLTSLIKMGLDRERLARETEHEIRSGERARPFNVQPSERFRQRKCEPTGRQVEEEKRYFDVGAGMPDLSGRMCTTTEQQQEWLS
jgi:hypothetical protein